MKASQLSRNFIEGQVTFFELGEHGTNVVNLPEAALKKSVEEIITENRGLVGYCMTMTGGITSYNRDDVEQAGLLALWRATEGFDESKGSKFSSYAISAIRRAMIREVNSSKDKATPESLEFLEEVTPSRLVSVATSEETAFQPKGSEVITMLLKASNNLRSVRERKGVIAFTMHVQGYSGQQISDAIGVGIKSYTALISAGRKVIRENPLFIGATYAHTNFERKNAKVDLLGSEFELKYDKDIQFDVSSKPGKPFEATLVNLLSQEGVADYILNDVKIGEQVCILDKDVSCSFVLTVNEENLVLASAFQAIRKPTKKTRQPASTIAC